MRMKKALNQAKDYELKISNRVSYLANEEKRLIQRLMQTRQKASKLNVLKVDRGQVQRELSKQRSEMQSANDQKRAQNKSAYEQSNQRKLESAYNQYMKLKQERDAENKQRALRMHSHAQNQARDLTRKFHQAQHVR